MNKSKPIIEKINLSDQDKENIKIILAGGQGADIKKTQYTFNTSEYYKIARIKKITGGICCKCGKFNTHLLKYRTQGVVIVERYCSEHIPKL